MAPSPSDCFVLGQPPFAGAKCFFISLSDVLAKFIVVDLVVGVLVVEWWVIGPPCNACAGL